MVFAIFLLYQTKTEIKNEGYLGWSLLYINYAAYCLVLSAELNTHGCASLKISSFSRAGELSGDFASRKI